MLDGQNTNTRIFRPMSHNDDEPQAGQMNFTQNSIEALHRRVLSGHMVTPEAVAWAGGTQSDAAVAENTGRPFLCQKDIPKRREMSSATT